MKNTFDVFSTKWAHDVYLDKYSLDKQETWELTAKRVVTSVCSQYLTAKQQEQLIQLIIDRKFIPGGRYLANAGRPFHQVNNCFMFRAEDSREGWTDIMRKSTASLMTGGGIGIDYSALRENGAPVKRTGGIATGPMALMDMVNEAGRGIMQGGNRRSAIWAGLNWKHPDIETFLKIKDYDSKLKELKDKDLQFRLPMEGTNISVIYDTDFFRAIKNKKHSLHAKAKTIWALNCEQAFKTAEPGFSFNFLKDNESLRNAPIVGKTKVLTKEGYRSVIDIVNTPQTIWTGKQWASGVIFKKTKSDTNIIRVEITGQKSIDCDPDHEFKVEKWKGKGKRRKLISIESVKAKDLIENDILLTSFPEILETQFDSDGYTKNLDILKNRKKDIFPEDLYMMNNNFSSSFIAGLFDVAGSYDKAHQLIRLGNINKDFIVGTRRLLEQLGINCGVNAGSKGSFSGSSDISYSLVIYSDSVQKFKKLIPTKRLNIECQNYKPYRKTNIKVKSIINLLNKEDVYCCDVKVPEHSFMAEGVIISNCTEVTSEDDADKCNLGTVWINRFTDRKEFGEACQLVTLFLLCGGIYSDVPLDEIQKVGLENNRIGVGLGGIHEWLMLRNCKYTVTPELHKWLNEYVRETDSAAYIGARDLGIAIPKGKRAIAPTGTIGIIAETTTGIEPLFCKAYKRRYLINNKWKYQYVIDGAVKRLIEQGIKLENIYDSFDIGFKERVKFQADIQTYVDMSISSTCNLPSWGTELNNKETLENYSKILLRYAPRLRGFTCYPDGARGGQPLTRVSLKEAMENEGRVFEEHEHECVGGVCGV